VRPNEVSPAPKLEKGPSVHEFSKSRTTARPNPFKKAQLRNQEIEDEKNRIEAERKREFREVEKAKKRCHKKRQRASVVMHQTNSRGQPNMRSRMDLLLKKIQGDSL
jgi:predicted phage gp36 major capsid-like protein